MSWDRERKLNQKAACKASANSRTCKSCGRGAALKRDGVCRYCGAATPQIQVAA